MHAGRHLRTHLRWRVLIALWRCGVLLGLTLGGLCLLPLR